MHAIHTTHATYLYMHACTSLRFCLHPCMGCLRPQLFVSWRQTTWSPKLCHVVMRHEVSHILGRRLFGSGPWGPESISVVAGDLQAWCQPPARRTGGRITHGGGGPPLAVALLCPGGCIPVCYVSPYVIIIRAWGTAFNKGPFGHFISSLDSEGGGRGGPGVHCVSGGIDGGCHDSLGNADVARLPG